MADETKVIRIVIDASRAVDGSRAATAAWERMERAQASAAGSMDRMEMALGRIGGFLKAQIALQVAEIGSRFLAMAKASLDAAAGLGELADQMGITTQGLQALQVSAVQNGVKLEQLETGIAKFSQKMGEAADGSKEMIEALDRIGVKILDARGQLRPTEVLLGDVARAITSIDEPAKQTAAAVDFFGKAGAKMIPTLRDMASGMDAMQARAKAAGAVISDDTIAKLDALADRSSVAALRWRALIAEVVAPVATDGLERINTMLGEIISQLERGRASGKGFWETVLNDSKASGRIGSGPNALRLATPEELDALRREKLQKELAANADDPVRRQMVQDDLDRLNRRSIIDRQAEADSQETWARRFKPAEVTAPGVSNPGIKGAGQSEADAIAKARRDAIRDRDAQLEYAEASEKGARAVADLETQFKALKAAQDAYGKTADDNRAGVAALTAELERLMSAADHAKSLKDFNLGTIELEKSNELLDAENRLINESVETRAREVALIKLRQEVEGKSLDAGNERERAAIERREAAITQNERLKAQGEELKKANELWTAPLKSALESIQRTGADMWERLLENGKFSAEEFGQIFAKMARRAAAELVALATVRPVINMAVQGLGSIGLVSPGTASSLGYGSASSGGSIGGLGGGSSLFGGGSLLGSGTSSLSSSGGWLSGVGNWLNSPIAGSWSGISNVPAGAYGPAANTTGGLGLSGTTWGQGLGALAGAGMGIYQLATANGSTGKTIGGIASMVGAGVSLIPGVGQIAGPVISILGSILPSLFGEGEKRPPQPPLLYGAGVINPAGAGFSYAENSLNGAGGLGSTAGSIGGSVMSLFSRAGLTGVPGMIIGGDIASGQNSSWNGQSWQQQPYTQIGLHTPGGYERLTYNDTSHTAEQAADMLIAAMFKANVMRGGVSGVTPALQTAVANSNLNTAKAVQDLIDFVAAYEKLGKSANSVKDSIKALGDQFGEMSAKAGSYGLSNEPVAVEYNKQKFRLAQDFIDGMLNPLAVQLRALQDEKDNAIASATYIRDVVGGVYVDIDKITEFYLKKELALKDQYAQKSVANYQALIDRLTYGDLANASPTLTYSGTRASYMATLAQARAGSTDAANNLGNKAEAYATTSRSYFGSSTEYAALAEQIRADLVAQQSVNLGTDAGAQSAGYNALLRVVQQQAQQQQAANDKIGDLTGQVSALVAQLARR